MSFKSVFVTAVLAVASSYAAAGPVVYEGVLVSSGPVTGEVGGFSSFLNIGTGVDYWQFNGTAASTVTFSVNRLNGNIDPVLSFYRGTASADTSQFNANASWGGLTFLGSLDDEHPPFVTPGPNGDPFGSFTLTSTGAYTVVVGGGDSTDSGSYPYRLTATVAAPVPEPESWALMVAGIAALGYMRGRRKA